VKFPPPGFFAGARVKMTNDVDLIEMLWTAEVGFMAPVGEQQKFAVQRLRAVADYIESIPPHVMVDMIQRRTAQQPFGGICGAPFQDGIITSGWKGLWTCVEKE
jgi:hypothetical protein